MANCHVHRSIGYISAVPGLLFECRVVDHNAGIRQEPLEYIPLSEIELDLGTCDYSLLTIEI
jgi:hypothetical protein